jgi:hypothetical protein
MHSALGYDVKCLDSFLHEPLLFIRPRNVGIHRDSFAATLPILIPQSQCSLFGFFNWWTTLAPSPADFLAVALPISRGAHMMIATLPSNLIGEITGTTNIRTLLEAFQGAGEVLKNPLANTAGLNFNWRP